MSYTVMQKLSTKMALVQAERDYLIITGWVPRMMPAKDGVTSEEHWCRPDLGKSFVPHDVAIATQKMQEAKET